MIRIEGLSQAFPSYATLRDITFSVPPGAVCGLVGPLPSGKSALLRILATLERATAGEAWVAGHSIRSEPEAVRRAIGYVPQLVAAYDDMAVKDYLEFYALACKIPEERIEARVRAALELAGVPEAGAREFMATLDREQKQRLAVAKAVLHDPSVLLIDEPGAGLDLTARLRMRDMIRGLARPERTILLASNVMADLAGLCDSIRLIVQGQLVAEGSPEALAPSLAGARVLELKPGDKDDGLARALEACPGVLRVERAGPGALLAAIDFTLPDPGALVEGLRAAGHAVTAYRELELNIEPLLERAAPEDHARPA